MYTIIFNIVESEMQKFFCQIETELHYRKLPDSAVQVGKFNSKTSLANQVKQRDEINIRKNDADTDLLWKSQQD